MQKLSIWLGFDRFIVKTKLVGILRATVYVYSMIVVCVTHAR